ncbi:DsbA family protein [Hyphococcus luteus]|nr:DsbA family protein [Marinicaulis flavus]
MLQSKIAVGAALGGAFLLGALAVAYSAAQPKQDEAPAEDAMSHAPSKVTTSFSDLQEEEIGKIVRAYLMENPEVIIEAVNKYSYEQRAAAEEQMKAAAADSLPALLDPKTSYVAGKNPDKAKVAVVELYDYHCTYCKRAADIVSDMVKKDADVKVVFRELPILREESEYAAEMALAARDQGKFLDFHFALLDASGVLTEKRVNDIARKQGLDVEKMQAAIEKNGIPKMITDNHVMASALGVEGTPAFIVAAVDGSYVDVVPGFDRDTLEEKIKEAKKAAR